jgi:RND family efflux transporter MFP subunit
MNSRYVISILAGIIILTAALVGYGIYVNAISSAHVDKMAAAQYVSVITDKAAYRNLAAVIDLPVLRLYPVWMSDIRSEVAGRLTDLRVAPGDKVKAGQILGAVQNMELPSQLLQAESKINQARANYVRWENTLRRYQSLVAVGAVSKQQLEEAQANRDAAAAEMESNIAGRDQVMINQQSQTFVAPRDGDILQLYHAPGTLVGKDQALMLIGDFSTMTARTNMRDDILTQLLPLKSRHKLLVGRDVLADRTYPARFQGGYAQGQPVLGITLEEVDPPLEIPSVFRSVKWIIDNPSNLLEYGTYYQVIVQRDQPESMLSVPQAAVMGEQEQSVYVVAPDNRLELRIVKTGRRDATYVEVREGLREGDLVVVSGKVGLAAGMKVRVVQEDHYIDGRRP